MEEIQSKLNVLREKYKDEESASLLVDIEKAAKIASLVVNLRENEGIKLLLQEFTTQIEKINETLMTNKDLFKSPELGLELHLRKKWCKDFLAIFNRAETRLKAADNQLNNYLNK